MLSALVFLVPLRASAEVEGLDRCSADQGPEVGIGILCDRARLAIEARELSVAQTLAETARDLAPSDVGVWVLNAEVARAGRKLAEARQHFETASELEPSNPAVLIAMGDFEAEEGNVRGAAVLYERAADIDPDYPGLAARLNALGDLPSANEI